MIIHKDNPEKIHCHATLANPDADRSGPCSGPHCMAWRWLPLIVTPEWAVAVKKVIESCKSHNAATQMVKNDPAKYGLPTEPTLGYCGLAGKPEVMPEQQP